MSAEALPLRVLLLPRLAAQLVRMLDASLASFQASVARLAGAAAATRVAPRLEQPDGPLVKFALRLRGPTLVLPSAVKPRCAVVLRLGDVDAFNSFHAVPVDEQPAAQGEAPPLAFSERMSLSLSRTRLLIASSGSELDDDWRVRPGQPPWLQQAERVVLGAAQMPV